MCHRSCIEFGKVVLKHQDVSGKQVLEVGSYDVNGSLRSVVNSLAPSSYIGVDLIEGPSVDEICDVTDLVTHFGAECFDVVISTETLEHVKWWKKAVSNLKHVLKPGGLLILTVPNRKCGYHGTPEDHWRFEYSDLQRIFSDFNIEEMWLSPEGEGVMMRARKPEWLIEFDTTRYKLYSIMKRRRAMQSRGIEIGIFKTGIYLKMLYERYVKKQPYWYGKHYIKRLQEIIEERRTS